MFWKARTQCHCSKCPLPLWALTSALGKGKEVLGSKGPIMEEGGSGMLE
jgi:hypothetical protein